MSSANCSQRIRLHFWANDIFPRETFNQIQEDTYLLVTPLCRGSARVETDGSVLYDGDIRPGMLRLASPGECVRSVARSPMRAAALAIPGATLRQICSGHVSRVAPLLQPRYLVARLSTALLSAADLETKQRQLFVDGIAHSLLACLLGIQSRQCSARKPQTDRGLSDSELARCIEYADSIIDQRLDLSAWAAALGLSTTEFVRRFQAKTHQAPYDWFMNWRIDRAKDLLRDGRLAIAEIALRVGFYSQSHFTDAFRRRAGVSPGRWRAGHLTSEI